MAFDPYSHRSAHALAVTFLWRGRPRNLKFGRLASIAIVAIMPLLAIWYLGATGYYIFHDQLLASLISRQADMQYGYEDRIAALRSQLERQTSRALLDHQTLTTTMHDLAARGEQLEARATMIDTLVRDVGMSAPRGSDRRSGSTPNNPLLAAPTPPGSISAYDPLPSAPLGPVSASPALRLAPDDRHPGQDADPAADKHADLSTDYESARLTARFAGIEARQSDHVARLREPMSRYVERLQAALAETGLPLSRWKLAARGDVGGPFVPLPDGSRSLGFDENLALLRQAVARQKRLADVVAAIPLRQPLPGQLEVTSPFGARLDPFYGRAAMHTGMDLMGSYGAAVRATAGGIVTNAGPDGGYGRMVEIDHGNGVVTRYAHLSEIDVTLRQHVDAGTIVGRIGSTGRSTGPHLHYETRIDGEAVNPSRFLKAGTNLFGG